MSGNRKTSNFPALTTLPSDTEFSFISGQTNFTITLNDFLAALNVTGSIVQDGDPLGTPVLDKQGAVNKIRNLEEGAGIKLSVSPQNGLIVDTDLRPGGASGSQVLINQTTAPLLRSLVGVGNVQISAAGDIIQITTSDTPIATNTIVINSLSDLPSPVVDVITLASDSVYLFSSLVNVGANRFVLGLNTSIVGSSAFATGIESTNADDLFTGTDLARCIIGDMTIIAPNARLFNFVYTVPNVGSLVLSRLSIQSASIVGVFGNLRALLVTECGIPTTLGGWEFQDEIKILSFSTVQQRQDAGTVYDFGTSVCETILMSDVIVEPAASSVVIFDGLVDSGNIATNGYATVSGIKVIGAFTPSVTILNTDVRWLFANSFGLPNTTNSAEVKLEDNAVATVIAAPDTPVKLAGATWVEGAVSRYETDNTGRITYKGEVPTRAKITGALTAQKQGGGSDVYIFKLRKNGSDLDGAIRLTAASGSQIPVPVEALFNLVKDDYVDIVVENVGGTNNMLVPFAKMSVISDA